MLGAAGLLERDKEMAAFEALAAGSVAEGALAIVEGPAGIGKTALLTRAGDTVRASGRLLLNARGSELEREFAFGVARQLFEPALDAASPERRRALLDEAGPFAVRLFDSDSGASDALVTDASFEAMRALHRLLGALAMQWRPVLVVDDLHWADSATVRWLAYLAPRLSELPVLVLAAVRGDEVRARPELAALGGNAQLIRPAALTPTAVARILADAMGADPIDDVFAVACHHATGGNPLFLRELISELRAEHVRPDRAGARQVEAIGPAGIARVVLARLGRLSSAAVTVAGVASVLMTHADPVTVADLTELPEADVRGAADALVSAGILENRLPLTFVHPILRAAVYADMGPARRAELHARAASLLDQRGADTQDVAAHVLACDPHADPSAVATLRRAAVEAMARGAPENAVNYLRRALREPPAPALRPQVLAELGSAESCGVDAEAKTAIEHLTQALAGDLEPESRVRTARVLSGVLFGTDRGGHAARVLGAAIDELGDAPGDLVAPLVGDLATITMSSPEAQRLAGSYFARFAGLVNSEDAASRRIGYALASGAAMFWGDNDADAAALAVKALDEGRLLAAESAESLAFYLAPLALLFGEHAEEALRALTAAVSDAESRGSSRGLAMALSLRAATNLRLGHLSEAQADITACVTLCREIGLPLGEPIGAYVLIEVLVGRGELAAAQAVADEVTMPSSGSMWDAWTLYARARLGLEKADFMRAAEDARRCESLLRELRIERWPGLQWRAVLALGLAGGDAAANAEAARELVASELELARRFGAPRLIGAALVASAEVERALGAEAGQLIPLLEEAVAVLAGSTARLEHARALVALGATQRRVGAVALARTSLRAGLAAARACGAVALAAQAHDELEATGLRPRKILAGGRDALTPQERRVAEMAASGMSNREIAQALFLTSRTVETHLAHAYQKLDVRSRRDLAGRL